MDQLSRSTSDGKLTWAAIANEEGVGKLGRKQKGPSLFLISSYLIFDDTIAISLVVGILNPNSDSWKIYGVIEIVDIIIKYFTSNIQRKQLSKFDFCI